MDRITDELAVLKLFWDRRIAPYPSVSSLKDSRQDCFGHIEFDSLSALEDWRRETAPDPAGISQHTRVLGFLNIPTLEGFEEHMRAFTRVEHMKIIGGSFLSPPVIDCLAPMGSSLTRLELFGLRTTSHAIVSLLAKLPQLKWLTSWCLEATGDIGGSNSVSRIPFFEGDSTTLSYYSGVDQRGPPD